MEEKPVKLKQKVYWTRIHPKLNIYDLYDLTVRSLYDTYFVTVDSKTKQSYLFSYDSIGKTVFINRGEALERVKEKEGDRNDEL